MPTQDGYTFIRRVRTLEEGRAKWTRAVAVTASAAERERRAALLPGF
jgi:CheY-like chemotaxis protein